MSQNPDRQHHFWFHKRNGDGGGGVLQLVLNCGMLTGFTAAVMKSSLKAGIWLNHSRQRCFHYYFHPVRSAKYNLYTPPDDLRK